MHQTEIHAKLVSIMGDRLTAHIESLNVRTLFNIEPKRDELMVYVNSNAILRWVYITIFNFRPAPPLSGHRLEPAEWWWR